MNEEIMAGPEKMSQRTILKIVGFIFLFGLFVAGITALINRYFDPSTNLYVQEFLRHQPQALTFYFIFVIVASVIVPIPTLPLDLVMIEFIDPWPIIVIRTLGGIAGGSINFYLARHYGQPLLRRWFSPKNYQFVEQVSENISWKQFFIVALIPVINTELMAYAGGISKLKYRWVIMPLTIAIFYRLIFVYFVTRG
ncbi:MAG: VTT domain-containing protein [bacterium]|nr:VTT domain-containing protein [bacterium]